MNRKLVSIILALLLLCSMPFAVAEDTSVTVTDMKGREIALSAPAERIVALTAADCEILCALGAGNTLVGRGEYCDYPPEVLEVPSVQSAAETNIEQIISLQPEVVLMSTVAQTIEHVQALENAGIAVVVSEAKDIAGTYEAIRLIGALMGKDAEAEAMVADMQSTFEDIAFRCADTGKTVYFEISPLQYGLWTAGEGTYMHEMAGMLGLTNIFADVTDYAAVSEEQVLMRNPDYIVTNAMYFGEGPLPVDEIAARAGWESVNAVANGNIWNVDANMISRPGPRLKDAAQAMYDFVYGEQAE